MTPNVPPLEPAGVVAVVGAEATSRAHSPAEVEATHAEPEPPVKVDAIPATPPQEVLDQVASAAQTAELLHREGVEMRFENDPHSGRVVAQVRDLQGNVLRSVTPSQALEIAAGGPWKE